MTPEVVRVVETKINLTCQIYTFFQKSACSTSYNRVNNYLQYKKMRVLHQKQTKAACSNLINNLVNEEKNKIILDFIWGEKENKQ